MSSNTTHLAGKKILFVLGWLQLGGAERQAILLAKSLRNNFGAEVEVVGFYGHGDASKLCDEVGIPWRLIPFAWTKHRGSLVIAMMRLVVELRRSRPALIMAYTREANVPCGLVWKLTGARAFIWNQRDEGSNLSNCNTERMAIRDASLVISNSKHALETLKHIYGLDQHKTAVVANGVIPLMPKGDRNIWRHRLKLSETSFAACMVANLTIRKDHETLIRAWGIVVRNTHEGVPLPVLVLAGRDDGLGNQLKTLAFDCGLNSHNIQFIGAVEDIGGLLKACDLCVHSSRLEGCPNGVLEAMALGLPVVGTDIPGIREAVGSEGSEYLAQPGNAEDLARIIHQLLVSAQDRQRLGQRMQERIARCFTEEEMVNKVTDQLAVVLRETR